MDDEPKDWEQPEEEEAPESLQRKWDAEEGETQRVEKGYVPCPHCSKLIAKDSFSCIYCLETVMEDSGPIGRLTAILKRGNVLLVIIAIMILSFLFLMAF